MNGFSTPDQPICRMAPPPVRQNRYPRSNAAKALFVELDESSFKTPPAKKRNPETDNQDIHPKKKSKTEQIPLLRVARVPLIRF
jgi:hypothetical protein